MKTYEVYHVPPHLTRDAWCLEDDEINQFLVQHRKEYIHVATVHEVEDLDKVYELTNSIDQYWACNKKVAVHNENNCGHRSTHIMDIITTRADNGVILEWYVAKVGFEQILNPI